MNRRNSTFSDFDDLDSSPAVQAEPVEPASSPSEKSVFKLIHPLAVNGIALTELPLDFARLSTMDLLNIEQEMLSDGIVAMKNAAFSAAYCVYIAARATGVNINDLKRLSFLDANNLVQATQNFMLGSASREETLSGA